MNAKLAKLEQIIGYRFDDKKLLERAVTHRSWAYEEIPYGEEEEIRELQNEALEFVGDSVLGLAIAEQLHLKNPKSSEGDLTLMKHHLVSTETLAEIAKELKIGKFMRVGKGEEKTGGRRKQALLANTLEAIIGAIFADTGYISARSFIKRIFIEQLRNATPKTSIDFKTLLQETLQAQKLAAPKYKVVKTEGPPHNRTFFVEAVWKNGKMQGEGSSIKSAEMMAASLALEELKKKAEKKTTKKRISQT